MVLSSTHIVIVEPCASPGTCHMKVWAIQSLAGLWSTGDFTHDYQLFPTTNIPCMALATIDLPASYSPRVFRLSVHDSPLRGDLSVIWLYVSSARQDGSNPKSLICKVFLYRPPSTSPQLQLRSSTCMDGECPVDRDISYAGHTEIFDSVDRVQRVLALPQLANGSGHIIDLPDQGDPVHVSAYSGALTYATHYSVVINYYQ